MKLRTKILSGFGAMLVLTGILGYVSLSLTDNMSVYSAEAARIDNARTTLVQAQVACTFYTSTNEQRYADIALQRIRDAEALFRRAMDIDSSESNRSGLEAAADDSEKLHALLERLVARQQEANALKRRADEILAETAVKYDDIQARMERLVRSEKMDADIDTFVALNNIRTRVDIEVRTGVASFSMTSPAGTKDSLVRVLNETYASLESLQARFRLPDNRAAFGETLGLYGEYVKLAVQYLEVQADVGSIQVEVSGSVSSVLEQATRLSEAGTGAVQDSNSVVTTAVLGVTALALLLGIAVALYISTSVNRQLGIDPGDLAVLADRVAGGDFDIDDGSRHIGVFDNLLKMVANLKKHIDTAQEQSEHAREESEKAMAAMKAANKASEEAQAQRNNILAAAERLEAVINVVSSASQQLSAQIEQSGRGAEEQAARMTETSTAMDEMNSTVLEVARNAGKAAEVSSETKQRAEAGAQIVHSAVNSIQDVQRQSVQLKEDMGVLEGHAQSINNIMAVISDIADQTNLLALNAAIEAARAGDAGRGFAVVADEVRNLAEKTMASTADVASAIRAIQESATKSVQQLDIAVQTISQATDLATQSGDALSSIVNMAEETADQVRAIAAASEEQSASSEEITQSIGHVTTISGETAEAMRQSSEAVAELTRQTQELSSLVAEMKRS